jgi:VIT1/CCC1 family predicted Fe2+/Mn2+ transporter
LLRGVLGANDGIASVAGIVVGVASASRSRGAVT